MLKSLVAALLTAAALALVAVPVAAADDPNGTQYGNPPTGVSTEEPPTSTEPPATTEPPAPPAKTQPTTAVKGQSAASPSKPVPTNTSGETLPFTGVDLTLVLAFGLLVVGGGLALRRAGRKAES